jgi:hypothetical protein
MAVDEKAVLGRRRRSFPNNSIFKPAKEYVVVDQYHEGDDWKSVRVTQRAQRHEHLRHI